MIPEQPGSRGPAHLAQQVLAAVLAAFALWSAVALVQGLREAWAMRTQWIQVSAVSGGWAGQGLMEVEVSPEDAARMPAIRRAERASPYQPDHVRLLVPDPPYSWHQLAEPLQFALHPQDASRFEMISTVSDAALALARLSWAVILGVAAWMVWQRLQWGRDTIWDGAGWGDSSMSAQRPGAAAPDHQVLHETRSQRGWLLGLSVVIGAFALWNLIGLFIEGTAQAPIGAGFWSLGTLGLLAFMLTMLARTRTRRLRWDDAGVADADCLGARRVPWSAIASWERVNINAEAQARYDRRSHTGGKGKRPADLWKWVAKASGGAELLSIPELMEPTGALAAFQQRMERQVYPAGRFNAQPDFEHDAFDDEDEDNEAADGAAPFGGDGAGSGGASARWREAEAEFEQHQGRFDRGLRWGFLGIVAPFALLFVATGWSAMKYQFMAERIEGEVIAVEGKSEVPHLTVRYPGPDGKPLEVRTDGTRSNQGIAVGTKVAMLRPASNPEDAKTADFWSVWIWPVITGVLLLIVAVPFWIGFVLLPRRDAKARAARRGAH